MNELRMCRALLFAQQHANVTLCKRVDDWKESWLVKIEESQNSINVIIKDSHVTHNLHIGEDWICKISYAKNVHYDNIIPSMNRTLFQEKFGNLMKEGSILGICLKDTEVYGSCIRCDYAEALDAQWDSALVVGSMIMSLPPNKSFDIILKAVDKLKLQFEIIHE